MDRFDDDLLALILRNNIGVWTYVQVSAVCKRLRGICHSDESLLISAALYTGGLTRTRFMGLFALTPSECKRLPHAVVPRAWNSGSYCMYGADAIEQAVRAVGGVAGWRTRVAARALLPPHPPRLPWKRVRRQQWELEEDLHRQQRRPHPPLPIGFTVMAER